MMAKRNNRVRNRGTLRIIVTLLVISGLIRITVTGQAIAENAATGQSEVAQDSGAPKQMAGPAETDALLEAIKAREARLVTREAALEDRLRALALVESEAQEQLAALSAAEEALRATLALADAAAETDIQRLTRVYENMKPKDAAALFEQMSPDFSAGFLGLMEPVAAAAILTLMSPEAAYSISAVLAGRNANVPTQ